MAVQPSCLRRANNERIRRLCPPPKPHPARRTPLARLLQTSRASRPRARPGAAAWISTTCAASKPSTSSTSSRISRMIARARCCGKRSGPSAPIPERVDGRPDLDRPQPPGAWARPDPPRRGAQAGGRPGPPAPRRGTRLPGAPRRRRPAARPGRWADPGHGVRRLRRPIGDALRGRRQP